MNAPPPHRPPLAEDRPQPRAKTARLFALAALLREAPFSVHELALHLYPGASVYGPGWAGIERAVQRDLRTLAAVEPHFAKRPGRPPRYLIRTARSQLPPLELLTLHAAARLTYHRCAGEVQPHRRALQRLTAWAPERLQGVLGRGLQGLGTHRRSRETLNMEKAVAAWASGHPLKFEYQKPGGSGQWRSNLLHIYLIEVHPQNMELYAVGLETSFHGDIRTFKLARMRALQVLSDETYRIPESFSPQEFFHGAWGVVGVGSGRVDLTLRFRPDAAYRIREGGYPHLGRLRELPDGSVEVTVQAPTDGSGLPREVLPWVYSFGPRVEVIGPPHIRAHWLSELREAARAGEDGG